MKGRLDAGKQHDGAGSGGCLKRKGLWNSTGWKGSKEGVEMCGPGSHHHFHGAP